MVMNEARLLRIARRIDLLLQRQLGQGIEVARMIAEPLYARDVLLVCDARPGSDLHSLARHFRIAMAEPIDEHGMPSTFGDSSSFAPSDLSRPTPLDSGLPRVAVPAATPAPRRWFQRLR